MMGRRAKFTEEQLRRVIREYLFPAAQKMPEGSEPTAEASESRVLGSSCASSPLRVEPVRGEFSPRISEDSTAPWDPWSHPVDDDEFLAQIDCGEITSEERSRLLKHLATCNYCPKELARLIKEGVIFCDRKELVVKARMRSAIRHVLAVAVAVCLVIGAIWIWTMAPSGAWRNVAQVLARAERAAQVGKLDEALSQIEAFLVENRTALVASDPAALRKLEALFEECAYLKARTDLQGSSIQEVIEVEEHLQKLGIESPRVVNLVLQAQRGFRLELAFDEAGTLAHLGYELDGAWLYKSSQFDATAKRLYQEYQKLLERYPDDIRLMLNFGHFCLTHSSLERAEAAFQKVLELDQENVRGLVGMGMVQFELRNFEQARVYFERAISVDPSFHAAKINLAICLEAENRKSEAQKLWEELRETCPDPTLRSRIEAHWREAEKIGRTNG
jgi:tetratricopeptide (TPR) repeat protein